MQLFFSLLNKILILISLMNRCCILGYSYRSPMARHSLKLFSSLKDSVKSKKIIVVTGDV